MSLNIKDPEAHRLAQELARLTGQSMTRIITDALRERVERLRRREARAEVDELLDIAAQTAALAKHKPYADHAAFLYDEHGLPK